MPVSPDLGAGYHGRPVVEAGGAGRAAGALGDVLVDFALFKGARAEALDRGVDHARVDFLYALPGETHAVQCPGRKVLHHHIAFFDEPGENFLALVVLGVQRDAALVVVQHREVKTVHIGDVAQLSAGRVSNARALDFDDVGSEPRQQLRARGSRLDVGHIQDTNPL